MFTYHRQAKYHETDQMGIIHHSNYVKWMEEARIAFIDSLGVTYKSMEEAGIASPVTGISLEYKKPVEFSDEIEIRVNVSVYNGLRLELAYEYYNASKDEICTAGTSKHCFLKGGRIISLKRENPELDEKIRGQIDGKKAN